MMRGSDVGPLFAILICLIRGRAVRTCAIREEWRKRN